MKLKTYKWMNILILIACTVLMFLGFVMNDLYNKGENIWLILAPLALGVGIIIGFNLLVGACPSCKQKFGKHIGKHCSNCGYEFKADDEV